MRTQLLAVLESMHYFIVITGLCLIIGFIVYLL